MEFICPFVEAKTKKQDKAQMLNMLIIAKSSLWPVEVKLDISNFVHSYFSENRDYLAPHNNVLNMCPTAGLSQCISF